MERVMCLMLGKEPGYFQKEMPRNERTAEEIPAAIVNIHREIQGMRKQVETMTELTEKIFSKCNANTKQIEDVKVHVRALAKTDYDRACEFLQEALAGGMLNGNDILLQADEAGIKRSDIMKAKKDLGVQIDIRGYGKNQKFWWYIPA